MVLRAGEAVAAYFGEAISSVEARRRHAAAPAANYILTVEEVFGASETSTVVRTSVDARNWGSVARFVNHRCGAQPDRPESNEAPSASDSTIATASVAGREEGDCGPNLVMRPVRKGSRLPVPVFWAARDILEGEELTIDYAGTGTGAVAASSGATSCGAESPYGGGGGIARVPCVCGATCCRGFLPFDPI